MSIYTSLTIYYKNHFDSSEYKIEIKFDGGFLQQEHKTYYTINNLNFSYLKYQYSLEYQCIFC